MREWIVQRRVNAQTRTKSAGAADWKALADFPEFAGALNLTGLGSPPPAVPPAATAAGRSSNRIAAGVCGILLGPFGVHKFILGYTTTGVIMLLVSLLTCGIGAPVMHIIGIIEGIIYLTKTEEEFIRTYVDGRKEWF
ncbi:MAG: NINE protein [Verrucomicrobia bacterium]|nr:NINE protein [Verrucomicrobiota bacterium]